LKHQGEFGVLASDSTIDLHVVIKAPGLHLQALDT